MSISSEISRISGNVSDAFDAIENKGVTIPSGSNSDDLATLISQISSGGGSSYTLLETKEFTVQTTSTSSTNVPDGSFSIPRTNHNTKILYIQVRDKVGKRNGYFFGADFFWMQPVGGATGNNYRMNNTLQTSNSGMVESTSTSQYGVYPKSPPTFASDTVTISMASRYNNSYSGTINGTYVVKVYDLIWPDNISPFT